jgi:hypothetical protein
MELESCDADPAVQPAGLCGADPGRPAGCGRRPQLQRVILKQLAEHPPAIICDLGQVEAIDPLCAGVFTSIRHPALGWPGTALVLCRTRPAVANTLLRRGVARHLAMHPPWMRRWPMPGRARPGCGSGWRWGRCRPRSAPAGRSCGRCAAAGGSRSWSSRQRCSPVGDDLVARQAPERLGVAHPVRRDSRRTALPSAQPATSHPMRMPRPPSSRPPCQLPPPMMRVEELAAGRDRSPGPGSRGDGGLWATVSCGGQAGSGVA